MSRPLCSLLLLLVAPHFSAGAEPEYRFSDKEVLRYKYVRNETCSYKAKTGKVTEVRALEYTLELRGPEEGGLGGDDVKATFRDIKNKVVSPEQTYSFNSKKTYSFKAIEKEPILGIYSAMPGESFEVSLYPSGTVSRVSGFSDLIGRASARGLFGSLELGKIVAKIVEKVVSEDMFKTGFGLLFVAFTEDSKGGGAWSVERDSEFSGIKQTFRIEYRFASKSDKKANIVVGGRYILSVDGTVIPKEGEIKGSAAFDVANGRLLFSKLKTSIKLPNISLSHAFEFKFLKALDPAEVGPESFEKPLRGMLELIERRRVKGLGDFGAPVYATEDCERITFFACEGDVVRVVEKREDGKGKLRVVTSMGREGWIREANTEKAK